MWQAVFMLSIVLRSLINSYKWKKGMEERDKIEREEKYIDLELSEIQIKARLDYIEEKEDKEKAEFSNTPLPKETLEYMCKQRRPKAAGGLKSPFWEEVPMNKDNKEE